MFYKERQIMLGLHSVLVTVHEQFVIRATHTRDRELVTITLQALSLGGKGGAGPSSLHIMLEGPTEYVNARWM